MESFLPFLPLAGSLLGVLLTGLLGLATYSWQENSKRQTEIAERRQKLYEDLNGNLFGLLLAQTNDERRVGLANIEKGWLFASDEVLKAIFSYMKTYDRLWVEHQGQILPAIKQDPVIRQDIEQGMAAIFLAMRRDLRSTQISPELAKTYMQFYQCGLLDYSVKDS